MSLNDNNGSRLGPYEIVSEIGRGGMAKVYQAYHPRMDRYVALKVMKLAVTDDEQVRERFQREARLIARLEHPHILPVYDFDGSHDPPYIVMRYLEGGTLKDVLEERSLPPEEVVYLLQQVGSALDYAHRQGVIHRDIKPSNIMIDLEGNAFVTDFGIARVTSKQVADGSETGPGVTLGTPDYMSPEQIMGLETIDERSDVYSLGVMVFQLATGRLPFESDSSTVTMLMHLRDPAPSAWAMNSELPPEIDGVLQRAMAKEAHNRYPTIQAFSQEIARILGESKSTLPIQLREAAEVSHQLRIQAAEKRTGSSRSASQSTPTEQNKTITAVYADAAEYAEMIGLSGGPEAAHQAVNALWDAVIDQVTTHGGTVVNRSEHNLLALWGVESAREDDPEQAVRAGLAILTNLKEQAGPLFGPDEPLPIRIGINTGLALLKMSDQTGNYTASGATISLTNRLAENADGMVLISHNTFRQVQGIFEISQDVPVRLRRIGGGELIETYRVEAAKPRPFRLLPRFVEGIETRLIGRRAELEQLQKAYFNAIEESETQMVTLIGEPGLGKSRLLYEFATWTDLRPEMYFIFRGRGTSALTKQPYALWRDLLSFRFEIQDSDSAALVNAKLTQGVAKLIGPDDELSYLIGRLAGFESEESIYFDDDRQGVADRGRRAVTEFFRRLAAEDPVVMQIEDLHQADDASLDLLTEVVNSNPDLRLLVVGTARPSLYERRPAWGSGQENHVRIDLRSLDKRDSRDLVAEILQLVDEVPRDLRDLIVERAEGNPFYLEELIKMLIEDRVIQKLDRQRWTVEGSRIERLKVPRTLVGLLQARFDSLLYPEKLTLQRAAVAGRVFHDDALVAMDALDDTQVDNLAEVLANLIARGFIYPREISAFANSDEYIFAQAMQRDLILETLLQRQLVSYSRAMANWLATQSGERAGEYDVLIAKYYEQAGEPALAAGYLMNAATNAAGRGAMAEAIQLLDQGLNLVDPRAYPQEVLRIELTYGNLASFIGDYDQGTRLLHQALELARQIGDRLSEANALAILGRIAGLWRGDYETGLANLEAAMRIARELDDRPTLMFILRQLGNHASITGQSALAQNYLAESLALAREFDDKESAANALNSLGENTRGMGDFSLALAYYDEALGLLDKHTNPSLQAMLKLNRGFAFLALADYKQAWAAAAEALELTQEQGIDYLVGGCWQTLGGAAIGLGDLPAARENLTNALEIFYQMGNWPELLVTAMECARLEALEGKHEEAAAWVGMADEHPALSADGRYRANQVRDILRQALPEDTLTQWLAQGAEIEPEELIARFQAQGH